MSHMASAATASQMLESADRRAGGAGCTLRLDVEAGLLEMVVHREGNGNAKPLHQSKGHTIGERISLVLMASQITPALLQKLFIHVDHIDCGAPQQVVSDLDGFLVMTAAIEERHDFVKTYDVVTKDGRLPAERRQWSVTVRWF